MAKDPFYLQPEVMDRVTDEDRLCGRCLEEFSRDTASLRF